MSSASANNKESRSLGKGDSFSGFDIRMATPNDAPAICELFKKIFSETMTLEHWHWKYERPLSKAIVVYKGGQLVAHYGGVGTDILQEGKKTTAIQITDLMVDPSVRHTVRSKSPFYLSAKKFLESFVGYNKPFCYAFGFPSERAMALSEKLNLYAPIGRMWEMTWQVNNLPKTGDSEVQKLDRNNFSQDVKKINKLWRAFSKNFKQHFVTQKDADYFRWRFLEHPSKEYSLYFFPGKLFGQSEALIVMRHDRHRSILMDFLSASPRLDSIIERAKKLASSHDGQLLMTWCTDVFRGNFQSSSAVEKSLPIIIPANTASAGPTPESQKNKWWLLPGDTDYL